MGLGLGLGFGFGLGVGLDPAGAYCCAKWPEPSTRRERRPTATSRSPAVTEGRG